jgi:hypothetical protein
MLVKLGDCWFAAEKVERIVFSAPPKGLTSVAANGSELKPLPPGKNNHYVSVRTFSCSDTTIAYVDSIEAAEALADELAGKVNAALASSGAA